MKNLNQFYLSLTFIFVIFAIPFTASPLQAINLPCSNLAYGDRVSSVFCTKTLALGQELAVDPDHLMAAMAFETGGTFNPSIKNAAGSGATGLIQFMPDTARDLGTTVEALAKMSAEQQLHYVRKYFLRIKKPLHTLEDIYMAILYPKAVGKASTYILFQSQNQPRAYEQNSGLDLDKDGTITKQEATHRVQRWLEDA